MGRWSILVALAFAFLLVLPVRAAVLISTLGQPLTATQSYPDTLRRYATDFTTTAVTSTATQVTAQFRNFDTIAHTLIPEIWTDVGGSPGSLLNAFDTVMLIPAENGAYINYTATDPGIALAASTTYWLVFGQGEAPDDEFTLVFMGLTNGQDVNGGGVYSEVSGTELKRSTDSGSSWLDIGTETPLFELQGATGPVPEPSRMLLMLGGFFGLALRRRRW